MSKSNNNTAPFNQNVETNARVLWSSACWAFKITWSTHALLTAGLIGLAWAQSIIPVGVMLVVRGLVNAVVAMLADGQQGLSTLWLWLILGWFLALAQSMTWLGSTYVRQRLADELNLRLTSDILAHAARLDLASFEDHRFQDIMGRAQQDTTLHFMQFLNNTFSTVTLLIQITLLFGLLVTIEPLILILLPLVLPYLAFQWRVARWRYQVKHSRITKRRWSNYFVSLLTSYQSLPEIKLLDLAPLLMRRFRELMLGFRDQDRTLYLRTTAGRSLFAVLSTTAFFVTFARVVQSTLLGILTVGDVAIYGGAAVRLNNMLDTVVQTASNALEQTLYISNLIEFFGIEPSIVEPIGVGPTGVGAESGRGEFQIKGLTFTYTGASEPALSDISLHIRPGETVAFIGENGAGKTTLANLLAGLYTPDKGHIFLDGVDLRDLSLDYLHGQISFVFQNFGCYETTVADNIAYGDWRRSLNNQQHIEQAARLANLHETITALPQGYNTLLGRRFGEHSLSRGQWQNIAVARAFARNGSIFILDEPTSNLDPQAEHALFSRFRELAQGRTTILISHRFSTVSMADRIVALNMGRIVEQGTHQALLARGGYYATLYNLHRQHIVG
jgi:ATP-binding cassette subfamily B protein